jgi:hypothetical protein
MNSRRLIWQPPAVGSPIICIADRNRGACARDHSRAMQNITLAGTVHGYGRPFATRGSPPPRDTAALNRKADLAGPAICTSHPRDGPPVCALSVVLPAVCVLASPSVEGMAPARGDVGVERGGDLVGHAECINRRLADRAWGRKRRGPASQNASTLRFGMKVAQEGI